MSESTENPTARRRPAVTGETETSAKTCCSSDGNARVSPVDDNRVAEDESPNSTTHSNKSRLQNVVANNSLLVLVLVLLAEMIFRLVTRNNDACCLACDRRNDHVRVPLLQTTEVEVGAVHRIIEKQIEDLRNDFSERIADKDFVVGASLHELNERVESVERSLTRIEKNEFYNVLEEIRSNKAFDGDLKPVEIKAFVKEIIDKEMEKHAADGMGRVDYAAAAGGGRVVKHSEPYNPNSFMQDKIHVYAQNILQPSFGEPGQCFALKGNTGYVHIRLRTAIIPEAITLEHVAESVAYDRSSAPKDCKVVGWLHNLTVDPEKMLLLTKFSYDLEKNNIQTFDVLNQEEPFLNAVNTIRFDFTSNHGNPDHTCIYRLRVHGHKPDSLPVWIPRRSKNDSSQVTIILQ